MAPRGPDLGAFLAFRAVFGYPCGTPCRAPVPRAVDLGGANPFAPPTLPIGAAQ